MCEWQKKIQQMIAIIDTSIKRNDDEILSLHYLSHELGYSEFYLSRKFREISGMQYRDYLRYRRLAFALKDLRDSGDGILEIALRYGFSSHEAFTRAFKEAYHITPSEYRQHPEPVVLRTIIKPFDCYLSRHTNFCISEIIRASAILISGRSKALFRDRTVRQSAACSTASKENWTIWAAAMRTAEAARLWHLSMTRPAESAVGESLLQNAMAAACPLIIKERFLRKCF